MLLWFQFECYKYLEIISIGDKILLVLQWFQFECCKYLKIILRRQNSACVANIWVPSLQTFYLNCVTPVASRAAGGHGGKHRNLPIFASARFSSSPSSIFLPHPNFLFLLLQYFCSISTKYSFFSPSFDRILRLSLPHVWGHHDHIFFAPVHFLHFTVQSAIWSGHL